VSARLHVNGIAGVGYSKVTVGKVTATTFKGNCLYDVEFTDTDVISTCHTANSTLKETAPNSVYGVDIDKEGRYHAFTYQAGVNATWRNQDWVLRGGLLFLTHRRSDVDDIVASRSMSPTRSNQLLVLEAGYKPTSKSLVYLRGQMMRHQFLGELPMTYNSVSAGQFNNRYGFLTRGLALAF
jgi:hypothetical protein